jgi:hypothetical protein
MLVASVFVGARFDRRTTVWSSLLRLRWDWNYLMLKLALNQIKLIIKKYKKFKKDDYVRIFCYNWVCFLFDKLPIFILFLGTKRVPKFSEERKLRKKFNTPGHLSPRKIIKKQIIEITRWRLQYKNY